MKSKIILLAILMVIPMGITVSASPLISSIYPSNGATNVPVENGTTVYLKATIVGNLSYVAFQTNKTGSWQKIYEHNGNLSSNTTIPLLVSFNKRYYWGISAKNTTGNWTNATFSFTTRIANDIIIMPSAPRAGKNILFMIDTPEASGYLTVKETGNIYLVEFKNKIGMVELGTEYGNATITIIDYGSKTFSISSPYAGELYIDAPSNLNVNEKGDFSVLAQGKLVSTQLRMISPTGHEKKVMTSETGTTKLSFNEAGNWTLIAEIYDTVTTSKIDIIPEPLVITIPHISKVGEEMTIKLSSQANVIVSKDEATWTYQSDAEGNVYFTPPFAGRYLITATTTTQSGTKYFTVLTDTVLSIKDEKGLSVTSIKKDDFLFIQVSDKAGNSINSGEISVYADGISWKILELTGGTTVWQVDADANQYNFEYSSTDSSFSPASINLPGIIAPFTGEMPLQYNYYYIVILVIAVIIVLLIIAQKKGWINIKSLNSILGKEEDEEEGLL